MENWRQPPNWYWIESNRKPCKLEFGKSAQNTYSSEMQHLRYGISGIHPSLLIILTYFYLKKNVYRENINKIANRMHFHIVVLVLLSEGSKHISHDSALLYPCKSRTSRDANQCSIQLKKSPKKLLWFFLCLSAAITCHNIEVTRETSSLWKQPICLALYLLGRLTKICTGGEGGLHWSNPGCGDLSTGTCRGV